MGRTCGEPDEIKKNAHPKKFTALFREQAFHKHIQKIWRNWRANAMIGALSDAQRKDMRVKIIGLGLFHKVKADWGYNRTWTNDYLKGEPGFGPAWKALRDKGVRIASRSIRPRWWSIRFRLALRTYAPWGCIVRALYVW